MEPKPKIEWTDDGRRWILNPPIDSVWPNYVIAIYRPYGSMSNPYVAVADYWSDYADTIITTYDLDEAKAAAEKHWFSEYVNR